ncbi:MAG: type VI secretion protein IcmF/TssM N-terminal domain-containing protein, partial [Phycisphaerae bacterium]
MSLTSAFTFGFAFSAAKSASWGVALTTLAAGEYSELLKLIPKDGTFLATLGIGAVVVSLGIGAFQWFISIRDKAKGVPFAELVKGAVGVTPAIADPAQRARLDDLRRKFDDGVQKFRAAGKDLYSLPRYLLDGPAGSGKTEARRHCNVGFPPGLQDYLQGAGGTLNMHWWFTNHAVVLDPAGRMFMESAGPDAECGGGEWGEFLKLLKRSRPNQPVNGMFLVIGADSLIRDKSEDIESKAGRIAQQLDTIQRTLDVRFPVFVIITKCDLIAGFREFFDNVTDPNLQHQLLGWSTPDQLDSPLRVELVEEHMKQVKHKLTARRLALVADSTRYAQGTGKRMD